MMRSSFLRSQAGFTLTELLVALGLTAMLLVFVGMGSLFVERYIRNWLGNNAVAEQATLLGNELVPRICNAARVEIFPDSTCLVQSNDARLTYRLVSDALLRNGHCLTRTGIRVDTFAIARYSLPEDSAATTLLYKGNRPTGLYSLTVVLSDRKGNYGSLRTLVKNNYEYQKYRP